LMTEYLASIIFNAIAFEELAQLKAKLELENEYLREQHITLTGHGEIIGDSPALQHALGQCQLVATTDAGVLLLGESGTGKELFAKYVHDRSRRATGPLIRVNCAAVPGDLFESEFFGHVKGAFTGAVKDRTGRFQMAHGGTLFLDEVGEIPLELQGKLLRVLQEGTFERVGEDRTHAVDVRVIAATNRDLRIEVAAKRFREDLYYRLAVFPIALPPLRDRPQDIPLLATHFLEHYAARFGRPMLKLRKRHVAELCTYNWPGNIRELQHVVERAVITATADRFEFVLGPVRQQAASPLGQPNQSGSRMPNEDEEGEPNRILTYPDLEQLEKANIERALAKTNGKVSGPGGAAELLKTNPSTLASRIKKLKSSTEL
jgi:transcriptional regulator with GAF, ATPase, and Fis domain